MKVVNPLKGKKQTPEHIAKRIASRFANGNYTGQIPWNKDIHTGHAPWFGKKRSLEDRQKMSRSRLARRERLGYINTPEAIKKVADALRGRPRPESHKARMREVMRGRVVRPPGWHHSDDTRKKLSVAKL